MTDPIFDTLAGHMGRQLLKYHVGREITCKGFPSHGRECGAILDVRTAVSYAVVFKGQEVPFCRCGGCFDWLRENAHPDMVDAIIDVTDGRK